MSKTAICPGSFDPITGGHLDIIRRSAKLFDRVIVVVMSNYRKVNNSCFSVEERMELIRRCTKDLPNVEVDCDFGLLAEYARRKNADVIVKGLRAVSDFEDEFQQALTNKKLNSAVETVFMAAGAENMFLSSSMIKQVCRLGGDVTPFLPEEVSSDIIDRLRMTE
ncbi:MAG: pantetheine-phosphate adenylyltransferase [Oscillospiraceae bacterium]|nr:pantetheine-phosphate adenylyltransferase [Oscillospiraceae bacterium]MDD7292398.1 pantetheine-phosphate adenylyltransferase [Clostridiaceae bacterium]MDY5991083.1 pantetheine-phosphate adenylyltransferase [Oscillospiraceae bacterium]